MSKAHSLAWSVGGQIASTALSMVSTVILARILTPTDFGAFAFALAVYSGVQWLLQMGMSQYVLREAELTPRKLNGAFAMVCAQGLAASLIVAIAAPVAGWFSNYATIGWVTLSVALVPFLNAPEAVSDALWVRTGRFASVGLLQIAKSAVQTIVSVAVEWQFHWGPFSLVAGLLAMSLTSFAVAVAALIGGAGARLSIDREQWRILRGFGSRSFLLTLGQAGSIQLPTLLIGRLVGVDMLGQLNRAGSALDALSRTVSGSVMRVAAPQFYRRINAGEPAAAAVAEIWVMLLFFVWPSLAGIAALSGPIIHLLYGAQWDIAARALPMLCLALAIDAARSGAMEILLVRDRLGLNARIEFAHAGYAILFVIVGAYWGLWGVLWGKIAESLLTMLIYFRIMARMEALPGRDAPRILAGNGLLAAAAGVPPLLLMHAWGWPETPSFGRYVLAIGSGLVGWGMALLLIGHPYVANARRLLSNRSGGSAAGPV